MCEAVEGDEGDGACGEAEGGEPSGEFMGREVDLRSVELKSAQEQIERLAEEHAIMQMLMAVQTEALAWRNESNSERIDELRNEARDHYSESNRLATESVREAANGQFGNAARDFIESGRELRDWSGCHREANELEYMPDREWYRDHGVER